jgi:dTMP kinase
MSTFSGKLISIEGGEGAGKSTVLAAIKAWLEQHGHTVVVTREPGGTPLGEQIRALLLAPEQRIDQRAELLLMFAARAQLVAELVRPALACGQTVLSDRFTDASFAYQGGGRGLPMAEIAWLETHFVGIQPDLTLLLDLGVEQGLARAQSRGQQLDRIELERLEFFQSVRRAYLDRAANEPDRIRVIDASQPPEAVRQAVLELLQQWKTA